MSKDEIIQSDLKTIYRLIDIHADMNGLNKKKNKRQQEVKESESYIDNIKF